MRLAYDLLYNANIKINDEFSIGKILDLAGINRSEDFKSLELQVKNTNIYSKTEVKIQVFDEQENELETYDSSEEYNLIYFILGFGDSGGVLGDILKENKTTQNKAIKLYLACIDKNEEKVEKLKKELSEELINFDNKNIEPLIVVRLYDFIDEVEGIKMEIRDIQYRPTSP